MPIISPELFVLTEGLGDEIRITRMYDGEFAEAHIRPVVEVDGDAVWVALDETLRAAEATRNKGY